MCYRWKHRLAHAIRVYIARYIAEASNAGTTAARRCMRVSPHRLFTRALCQRCELHWPTITWKPGMLFSALAHNKATGRLRWTEGRYPIRDRCPSSFCSRVCDLRSSAGTASWLAARSVLACFIGIIIFHHCHGDNFGR